MPWVDRSLQIAVNQPKSKSTRDANIVVAFMIARKCDLTEVARNIAFKFLANYPRATYSPALKQHWTSAADLARLFDYKAAVADMKRPIFTFEWPCESRQSYRTVKGIYDCNADPYDSDACGGYKVTSKHTYRKSQPWIVLRNLTMAEIYRAPLALSIIDAKTVIKVFRSSECLSCRQKSSDVIMDTIASIQREISSIAVQVCHWSTLMARNTSTKL